METHNLATNVIMDTCRSLGGATDWGFQEVCGVGGLSVFVGFWVAMMVAVSMAIYKIGRRHIR